ncbi:MAG TPA: hypothetical protein VK604_08965 [Bryobacteraceae bacterium]|nr:hypothetical protein [Bryobacteraceae bacterium]
MTTTFGDHPHSAVIQVPTGDANGSKYEIPCTFEGIHGKRLLLESPERLRISTPVSVEYNDALFLGEVISCRRESGDIWQMEVKVEQILTGLQSLMALRAGLLGEAPDLQRAAAPVIASVNRFGSNDFNKNDLN